MSIDEGNPKFEAEALGLTGNVTSVRIWQRSSRRSATHAWPDEERIGIPFQPGGGICCPAPALIDHDGQKSSEGHTATSCPPLVKAATTSHRAVVLRSCELGHDKQFQAHYSCQ